MTPGHLRRIALGSALLMVVPACGESGSSGGNAEYGEFCLLARDLDARSEGTHGEDPAVISDPEKMKTAWETISVSAVALRDESPDEVKADVATLVDSIVAMNEVFKSYKYNLREMAQVPAVREKLDSISNNAEVNEASQRFAAFMAEHCDEGAS